MARFSIPRVAHCHGGSVAVPDMTLNCPLELWVQEGVAAGISSGGFARAMPA